MSEKKSTNSAPDVHSKINVIFNRLYMDITPVG